MGGSAWAQTSTFTADKNATYTCGQKIKDGATDILTFQLGGLSGTDTWTAGDNNKGLKTSSAATITDGVITSGTYYVVTPTKDLKLDIYFYIPGGNTYIYVDKSGSIGTHVYSYRRPNGSSPSNWQSLSCTKLEAGTTYYIYATYNDTGIYSFTAATYEDCTINYTFGGATIKSEVVNGAIGTNVDATLTSMWNEGNTQKYYVADNATTSFTVKASDNTFEVALREAATVAATVNAIDADGTVLATFNSATTGVEGEDYDGYVYYTRVVLYNSKYYAVPAKNGNTQNYGKNGLKFGEPATVTYTLDETITYYAEEKDLTLSRSYATNGAVPERASGGNWSRLRGGAHARTAALEAGVYTFEVSGRNSGSSAETLDIKVYSGSALGDIIASPSWNSSGNVVNTVNNILVPEGGSIAICNPNSDYNSNICIDYVIVRKLYDVTDVTNVYGKVDYSSTFMADGEHKDVTISQGQKVTFTFKNHGNGEQNYYNWLLRLSGTTGVDHTLRADNFVIGDSESSVSTRSITEDDGAINWADFLDDMKDASVTMIATYTRAGMFSVEATATGTSHTYKHNFAYNEAKSGDINMELGVEKAWLEVTATETTALPYTVTIPSSGYGSLAVAQGLDFSGVEGLTAYVVTKTTNDAVTLTSVDELPASSGVILKGTPNAPYSIPVKADAAYAGTNLLSAAVTATDIEANTAYILQYGEFHLVTAASTVPAGKAYLLATHVPSPARTMNFVFEDETQGISAVETAKAQDGQTYNLAGQRVKNAVKGLYIVNGKKVIK